MFVETKTDGEATVKKEPWREILLKAAAYMEEHGHCKLTLETRDGRVCVMGALYIVAGFTHSDRTERLPCGIRPPQDSIVSWGNVMEARNKLSEFVKRDAVAWNNDHRRPGSEVVAGMRGAALHF
jgi:hypothetical protein